MMHSWARMAVVVAALFATTGCKGKTKGSDDGKNTPPEATTKPDQPPPTPETQADKPAKPEGPEDHGDFSVTWEKAGEDDLDEIRANFQSAKIFSDVAAGLNDVLALPHDLPIVIVECGEPNAFYNDEKRRVEMCYELINEIGALFEEHIDDDKELTAAVEGATLFALFHEIGHALVHVYDLPITGKEEDAVDQLATFILAGAGDDGIEMALDGAHWFLLQGEETDSPLFGELAFWDEHSFDTQRFFNIACWVYGAEPDKAEFLVKEEILPEERAEICEQEFEQLAHAWVTLLDPHTKPE